MSEGGPQTPENMWNRLSAGESEKLLESWKKRAEELKAKLQKMNTTNESKRRQVVSALEDALGELASLIEGRALESNAEMPVSERQMRWRSARAGLLNVTQAATDFLDEEPEKTSECSKLHDEIRGFEKAIKNMTNASDAK